MDFHSDTRYEIMFGPDNCGPLNIVHAIFRYKDFYYNMKTPVPALVSTFISSNWWFFLV